jgi:hypothetical protein
MSVSHRRLGSSVKSLREIQIIYLVPFYIEVSGKGTVMTSGLLHQLFSFGETIVFVASAFWIQWSQQPWYVLTASRLLAFGSAVVMASAHRGNLDLNLSSLVPTVDPMNLRKFRKGCGIDRCGRKLGCHKWRFDGCLAQKCKRRR